MGRYESESRGGVSLISRCELGSGFKEDCVGRDRSQKQRARDEAVSVASTGKFDSGT